MLVVELCFFSSVLSFFDGRFDLHTNYRRSFWMTNYFSNLFFQLSCLALNINGGLRESIEPQNYSISISAHSVLLRNNPRACILLWFQGNEVMTGQPTPFNPGGYVRGG